MISTLCSLQELQKAKTAVDELKAAYPSLFAKWVHVAGLTRCLHLKYEYMGCLLMEEDVSKCQPAIPYKSVLRLYEREVQKLKTDEHADALKNLFDAFQQAGYAKTSLLALGRTPEMLTGSSSIQ